MKKLARVLSLLLVISVLLAVCGCFKYHSNTLIVTQPAPATPSDYNYNYQTNVNVDPNTTMPTQVIPVTPSVSTPEVTTAPPTTAPTQAGTTAPADTTAPVVTTEGPTAANPGTWNKDQIISYLADAVNKTKAYTGQVSVTRSERFGVTVDSISPNLPALKSIANSVIPRIVKPVDETITFNGGTGQTTEGETIPLLLPKRQAFSLPSGGVQSATASQAGNNIQIEITLVREQGSMTVIPPYHSGSIGYLNLDNFDLGSLKVNEMNVGYPGSTMKAVINPDGYVVSADYNIPIELDASGSAIGINASFTASGYQSESWIINW